MQRTIKLPLYSSDLTLFSYYSTTYDVIGWDDVGDSDDEAVMAIVATFARAGDAEKFAKENGNDLLVRPPVIHVKEAMRWMASLEQMGNPEGVTLVHKTA